MHPKTLYEWSLLKARQPNHPFLAAIPACQHFYVGREIYAAAQTIAQHECDIARKHDLPLPIPSTARLPSKCVVITSVGPSGREDTFLLVQDAHQNIVAAAVIAKGLVGVIGAYDFERPATGPAQMLGVRGDVTLSETQNRASLVHLAFIVSLINTPTKIVQTVDTVSRQHRKRVEAVTGAPTLGYTRIAWELGAAKKAHGRDGEGEGGVALHWCRAYFRRACENEPKAEWLNLPYKGGWGWYCWVKDCWKGHYRFGLKLHDYHPEIAGADGKIVHRPAQFTASSADRLAMLEAQKQAAIRAASRAA